MSSHGTWTAGCNPQLSLVFFTHQFTHPSCFARSTFCHMPTCTTHASAQRKCGAFPQSNATHSSAHHALLHTDLVAMQPIPAHVTLGLHNSLMAMQPNPAHTTSATHRSRSNATHSSARHAWPTQSHGNANHSSAHHHLLNTHQSRSNATHSSARHAWPTQQFHGNANHSSAHHHLLNTHQSRSSAHHHLLNTHQSRSNATHSSAHHAWPTQQSHGNATQSSAHQHLLHTDLVAMQFNPVHTMQLNPTHTTLCYTPIS